MGRSYGIKLPIVYSSSLLRWHPMRPAPGYSRLYLGSPGKQTNRMYPSIYLPTYHLSPIYTERDSLHRLAHETTEAGPSQDLQGQPAGRRPGGASLWTKAGAAGEPTVWSRLKAGCLGPGRASASFELKGRRKPASSSEGC